ncbi:MAG: tetraacyldisaccharide 4'-kinase [Phycisphaerae bacterium]
MNEESYFAIITGRRQGPGAALARGGLLGLSAVYRCVTGVRNAWYDYCAAPKRLGIPVISVGNLTVGGTGKTPMTIWLCRRLLERGLKPAVLSRGYKADEHGRADEMLLISRHCPRAVVVGHPNRYLAGRLAIEEYAVQTAVLDDGFQHRRLDRDLDLVLIDAVEPWGLGHLLPRGLLREGPAGLRRADAVILTRCDQVDGERLEALHARIRDLDPELPVIRAVHEPTGFVTLLGRETVMPEPARLGCFAGIARPEAFVRTLAGLDRAPADTFWWPDHHRYTPADARELIAWVADAGLDALVTTEKDAVKLAPLEIDWPVPIAALRVEIAFWGRGDMILAGLIDDVLAEYADERRPDTQPPAGADTD